MSNNDDDDIYEGGSGGGGHRSPVVPGAARDGDGDGRVEYVYYVGGRDGAPAVLCHVNGPAGADPYYVVGHGGGGAGRGTACDSDRTWSNGAVLSSGSSWFSTTEDGPGSVVRRSRFGSYASAE